jgi:hypothetical protein
VDLLSRVTPRLNSSLQRVSHETVQEVSKIGYLTWWNFPKKAWLIIIVELGIIASLSGWLYSTYLNNLYFQTYVDSLSPALVPVLSVAFGISSASIATYLYLGMKRVQALQEPETLVKKRVQSRRTSKRPVLSTSSSKVADPPSSITAKLKPIAPSQSHVQTQKPPLKEREDHTPNSENRKQPEASHKG